MGWKHTPTQHRRTGREGGSRATGMELPDSVVSAVQQLGARHRFYARTGRRVVRIALAAGVAAIVLYVLAGQLLPDGQITAFVLPRNLPDAAAKAVGVEHQQWSPMHAVRAAAMFAFTLALVIGIARQNPVLPMLTFVALAYATGLASDTLATQPRPGPTSTTTRLDLSVNRGDFEGLAAGSAWSEDPGLRAVLLAQAALVRTRDRHGALTEPERAAVLAAAGAAAGRPGGWRLPDQAAYAIEFAAHGGPTSARAKNYAARGNMASSIARYAAISALSLSVVLGLGGCIVAALTAVLRRKTERIGAALRLVLQTQ